MTETEPGRHDLQFQSATLSMPAQQRYAVQAKQGRAVFGIDMRIVGPDGEELPWDAQVTGDLQVRGPWDTWRPIFRQRRASRDATAGFDTGDVATIDPDGFMQITDRAKDVIKSGGEWISSIDIENAATHPREGSARRGHPRNLIPNGVNGLCWSFNFIPSNTRPKELLEHLQGKLPRWWLPDEVLVIEQMPLGATGKIDKKTLRRWLASRNAPISTDGALSLTWDLAGWQLIDQFDALPQARQDAPIAGYDRQVAAGE